LLKKSAPSRIIWVSSASAFFWNNLTVKNLNYSEKQPLNFLRASFIYGNSKLCNVIAANGFAERLRKFGVTSNSLHPGLVNTHIHLKTARILGIETFGKLFTNTVLFLYGKVNTFLLQENCSVLLAATATAVNTKIRNHIKI
jgi:NAD(P)-dependent dehydrogenase (short-subunit alcohol dehydrogenase family)